MKHNFFKIIFNIYFAKKKQLIVNLLILSMLFGAFSILQYQKILSDNKFYKHTIVFYNVPYTRDGGENWYFEGTGTEVQFREKRFKIDGLDVFDIHIKKYSNSAKKEKDYFSLIQTFINTNLESHIKQLQEKIDFMKSFHFTTYYDPSTIYILTKKIEKLRYKSRYNYALVKNVNFREIFGFSFILSFIIVTLVRLFMLDLQTKKSK